MIAGLTSLTSTTHTMNNHLTLVIVSQGLPTTPITKHIAHTESIPHKAIHGQTLPNDESDSFYQLLCMKIFFMIYITNRT